MGQSSGPWQSFALLDAVNRFLSLPIIISLSFVCLGFSWLRWWWRGGGKGALGTGRGTKDQKVPPRECCLRVALCQHHTATEKSPNALQLPVASQTSQHLSLPFLVSRIPEDASSCLKFCSSGVPLRLLLCWHSTPRLCWPPPGQDL